MEKHIVNIQYFKFFQMNFYVWNLKQEITPQNNKIYFRLEDNMKMR